MRHARRRTRQYRLPAQADLSCGARRLAVAFRLLRGTPATQPKTFPGRGRSPQQKSHAKYAKYAKYQLVLRLRRKLPKTFFAAENLRPAGSRLFQPPKNFKPQRTQRAQRYFNFKTSRTLREFFLGAYEIHLIIIFSVNSTSFIYLLAQKLSFFNIREI